VAKPVSLIARSIPGVPQNVYSREGGQRGIIIKRYRRSNTT